MRIIVAGNTPQAVDAALCLARRDRQLVLVSTDAALCRQYAESSGQIAVHGSACDPQILRQANIGKCEVYVTVSGNEAECLVNCEVAKRLSSARRFIAVSAFHRVNTIFQQMGIHCLSFAATSWKCLLENMLTSHGSIHALPIIENRCMLLDFRIDEADPSVGNLAGKYTLPKGAVYVGHCTADGRLSESDSTILMPGDHILALESNTHRM